MAVLSLLYYIFVLPFVCCIRAVFRRRRQLPDLGDDIALVTGAGQGLGRALALRLAECGATLVLWDINEESVRTLCDQLNAQGREAFGYCVDCSKKEEIYAAADTVRKEVGNVSILVNNAGILVNELVAEIEDQKFEKTIAVNFMAHYWTAKAFLPWMLQNDYGRIVSICSVAAFLGGFGGYGPSKAAVYNFCDGLRLELGLMKKDGVSVSCICPWAIDTGMTAHIIESGSWLLRIYPPMKAEDVANRVVWAIVDKEFYVVIPCSIVWTIWAKWMVPSGVEKEVMELTGFNKTIAKVLMKAKKH